MEKMIILSEKERVVYLVKGLNYGVDFYGKIEKEEWFNKQCESLEDSFKLAYEGLKTIETMEKIGTKLKSSITIEKCKISLNGIKLETIATLGFQPSKKNLNKWIKSQMLDRIPTID